MALAKLVAQAFLEDLGINLIIDPPPGHHEKLSTDEESEARKGGVELARSPRACEVKVEILGSTFETMVAAVACWHESGPQKGGLFDPGHLFLRGPCRWMQPSVKCTCLTARHVLHLPLSLL